MEIVLKIWNISCRFFRIGSVVLALHDASDVFMEAAKIFKYAENELGASVLFGFFAISWLLTRLIFFPFWVIHASRFVPKKTLFSKLWVSTVIICSMTCWLQFLSYHLAKVLRLSEAYDMLLYYVFNTMLLTLLVFHIYWWILICFMIKRQLKNRGQVGEDIRSGMHTSSSVLVI